MKKSNIFNLFCYHMCMHMNYITSYSEGYARACTVQLVIFKHHFLVCKNIDNENYNIFIAMERKGEGGG